VEMMRLLVVGDAYYAARGHSSRSFALHQAAFVKAKELGDIEGAHYLIARVGDTYRELYGELDKALEAFEEALELARQLKDPKREAIMLGLVGITLFDKGNENANEYLDNASLLAQQDALILGHIAHYRGVVAPHYEAWQEASRWSKDAIRLTKQGLETSSFTKETATTLFFSFLNLGESEKMLKNYLDALNARQEAFDIAQQQGNQLWLAYALEGIAEIQHELGKTAQAQASYQQALELFYENNAFSDVDVLIETMKAQGYGVNPKEMVLA
jgi:tetratricopeptide (TPR) repeat protein